MDLSYTRGAFVAFMAIFVLLTAGLWKNDAAIGADRLGDRPTPRGQRTGAQAIRPPSTIHVRGGLLSVRLRNTPWDHVLYDIEQQTGIMIQVKGQLAGSASQEFEALPLERGLRRLFRDANVLFFYTPGTQEGNPLSTVVRVWVVPKAVPPADAQLMHHPFSQTAAMETSGEPVSMMKPAEPILPEDGAPLPERHAKADDQDERLTALQSSAAQGNAEALQRALFDPDQTIQAMAVDLLAGWGRQGVIDAALRATKSDQPEVRVRALSLLHDANQGDDRTALSALEEALVDPDVTVKSYALHALAERGGADAMGALRQALRDPDVTIKKMVIEGVAQTTQGRSLLQEALSDDNATVRSLARFWLEQPAPEGQ